MRCYGLDHRGPSAGGKRIHNSRSHRNMIAHSIQKSPNESNKCVRCVCVWGGVWGGVDVCGWVGVDVGVCRCGWGVWGI